jgi:hypothetical protein
VGVAADAAAGAVVVEEAEVVVVVALAGAVDFMVEAVVAGTAAAVDGRPRCRGLAVGADVQVEVTEVVVRVLVVGRCNDRKAIGRGWAACRRRIGPAAESVNDLVAVVRVLGLEQAALDPDRTLPVVAVGDQALAVVRVPAAVGLRKVNSTTSWILVAVVGGHPLVGLRSPAVLVDKQRAMLRTISCATGQLVDSVHRRSPVPRALE